MRTMKLRSTVVPTALSSGFRNLASRSRSGPSSVGREERLPAPRADERALALFVIQRAACPPRSVRARGAHAGYLEREGNAPLRIGLSTGKYCVSLMVVLVAGGRANHATTGQGPGDRGEGQELPGFSMV